MAFEWISTKKPSLVLAPMEGVTDAPMRALLTERGGFSFCVAEFLRINHELLPDKVFLEHMPELRNKSMTAAQVPVQMQLLGGHPERMALSALQACRLGTQAIDINFGCPAPLVNRNDGGATLLKYPERIEAIVAAVRAMVPASIPVSAKLRLGWDNIDAIFTNAQRAQAGGASWVTIHARTKIQGYAPPVQWKHIGAVRKLLSIPVVANGDIWSLEDFKRCQEETGCQHFMVGRGALADPSLPNAIAQELGVSDFKTAEFDWLPILGRFAQLTENFAPGTSYTNRRIKQWLKVAAGRQTFSRFDEIKTTQTVAEIFSILSERGA